MNTSEKIEESGKSSEVADKDSETGELGWKIEAQFANLRSGRKRVKKMKNCVAPAVVEDPKLVGSVGRSRRWELQLGKPSSVIEITRNPLIWNCLFVDLIVEFVMPLLPKVIFPPCLCLRIALRWN